MMPYVECLVYMVDACCHFPLQKWLMGQDHIHGLHSQLGLSSQISFIHSFTPCVSQIVTENYYLLVTVRDSVMGKMKSWGALPWWRGIEINNQIDKYIPIHGKW